MDRICEWYQEDIDTDPEVWDTGCNNKFLINNDDSPTANGFRFCCYCGGQLTMVEVEEPVDV